MPEIGDLIGDRYRLEEHLATGGMSDVWRATDVLLGRPVAVKVLAAALRSDEGFTARFRAEARLMAAVHHPGIADVYDCGESPLPDGGELLYLVMEYVEGRPLSALLAGSGRLEPVRVMAIVAQAGQALHAAHGRGIVHRDVKPGNLLVKADGRVVLVDFGVARSAQATRITVANAVVGTALYMAPEQAAGRPVSPATDVYALGALAYHALAGRPPFSGDSALQVALRHLSDDPEPLGGDIPTAVRAVVERALAKDPERRFTTAQALSVAAVAAGASLDRAEFTAMIVDPGTRQLLAAQAAPAMAAGQAAVLAASVSGRAGVPAGVAGALRLRGLDEPRPPMLTTIPEVPDGLGDDDAVPPDDLPGRGRSWAALAGFTVLLLIVLSGLSLLLHTGSPAHDTQRPPVPATSRPRPPTRSAGAGGGAWTGGAPTGASATGSRPSARPTAGATPSPSATTPVPSGEPTPPSSAPASSSSAAAPSTGTPTPTSSVSGAAAAGTVATVYPTSS